MPTAVLAVSSQLLWILRCQKNILEPFCEVQKGTKVMRGSGLGQGKNGIIFNLDMSGEMHMRRRSEVFGCIPHGRGALI